VQDIGTANRTVGATAMNATSSRAHTIVTITLGQTIKEEAREREFASDIVLVDLAGSERAESTGATGARLQEGIEINVSLSVTIWPADLSIYLSLSLYLSIYVYMFTHIYIYVYIYISSSPRTLFRWIWRAQSGQNLRGRLARGSRKGLRLTSRSR